MFRNVLLSFGLVIVLMFHASAQKVGVVMSGGGSSGLAHIGVLRALEENGIPIDYVAGTSMGALVAALYAVGMSPDEMDRLARSKEFYEMAKGIISEDYKYYFKKNDANPSWVNLRFELDSGLRTSLPVNIVSPYAMDIGLIDFMSQAIALAGYDFDSLYVPFRCVAADVAAKQAVIFRDGDICQAVRASFTYPLYMKPIKVKGRLLFDGGIYNNFPSDIVKKDFAPDIIIGSVVASDLAAPDQDDLASQLKSLLMYRTDYDEVGDCGIVIRPKIPSVPVMDFTRNGDLLDGGYKTATELMPEVADMIRRRVPSPERDSTRAAFNAAKPALEFDNIIISGLKPDQADYVQRSFRKRQALISFDQVKREYYKLAADDMIKSIYPRALFNRETGHFDLYLEVRPDNDIIAQFGGNISSRSINQAYIGLGYKFFRQFSLGIYANTHIGKFYTSGQLRGRIDFPWIVPFFVEVTGTINQWNYFDAFTTFFEVNKPSYLVMNDRSTEVSIGLPITSKIKAVPSVGFSNISNSYFHVPEANESDRPDEQTMNVATFRLLVERNTLNRKLYPTEGREYMVQARYTTGREINQPGTTSLTDEVFERNRGWVTVKGRYDQYFFGETKLRLGVFAEASWSSQNFFSNYQTTLLMASAFEPTPESKTLFLDQYRSNRYGAVGLKGIWLVWKNLDFRLETYAYTAWEKYRRNEDQTATYYPIRIDPQLMATAALVYHTPLGPVSISGNYYQKQEQPWSFLFHIGYILFNKRGLE
ncbi:MAG: patatin-like phospholipase family protein [Flavobacteriales bacterium]|nr:patatin-like phospholipase family protein [Flavobacteriales bacterium]